VTLTPQVVVVPRTSTFFLRGVLRDSTHRASVAELLAIPVVPAIHWARERQWRNGALAHLHAIPYQPLSARDNSAASRASDDHRSTLVSAISAGLFHFVDPIPSPLSPLPPPLSLPHFMVSFESGLWVRPSAAVVLWRLRGCAWGRRAHRDEAGSLCMAGGRRQEPHG